MYVLYDIKLYICNIFNSANTNYSLSIYVLSRSATRFVNSINNSADQPAVSGVVAELATFLWLVALGRRQLLVTDNTVSLAVAEHGAGHVEGFVIKEGSQSGERDVLLEGRHQLIEHRVRSLDVHLRRDDRAEAEVAAGQGRVVVVSLIETLIRRSPTLDRLGSSLPGVARGFPVGARVAPGRGRGAYRVGTIDERSRGLGHDFGHERVEILTRFVCAADNTATLFDQITTQRLCLVDNQPST